MRVWVGGCVHECVCVCVCVCVQGVLIGSSGIEMGQLRFYPKSLRKSDIEEIYQYGTRLSDMSTGFVGHTRTDKQSIYNFSLSV